MAFLGDEIHEAAGVSRSDIEGLELMVNQTTGTVDVLHAFYAGSKQHGMETALYDRGLDAIVRALIEKMEAGELNDPAYAAFRARHKVRTSVSG